METFVKKNLGFLMFYLVLIGGIVLINEKFATPATNQSKIVSLNK